MPLRKGEQRRLGFRGSVFNIPPTVAGWWAYKKHVALCLEPRWADGVRVALPKPWSTLVRFGAGLPERICVRSTMHLKMDGWGEVMKSHQQRMFTIIIVNAPGGRARIDRSGIATGMMTTCTSGSTLQGITEIVRHCQHFQNVSFACWYYCQLDANGPEPY